MVTVLDPILYVAHFGTRIRDFASAPILSPIIYVAAMVVMYVTAKIMKLSIRDYITYAFLDGLFGIIPIAFLLLKWTNVLYPSIICIGASVIFLAAIFIFQGDNIRSELNKRMHT
jgi:hypothetical protein